ERGPERREETGERLVGCGVLYRDVERAHEHLVDEKKWIAMKPPKCPAKNTPAKIASHLPTTAILSRVQKPTTALSAQKSTITPCSFHPQSSTPASGTRFAARSASAEASGRRRGAGGGGIG